MKQNSELVFYFPIHEVFDSIQSSDSGSARISWHHSKFKQNELRRVSNHSWALWVGISHQIHRTQLTKSFHSFSIEQGLNIKHDNCDNEYVKLKKISLLLFFKNDILNVFEKSGTKSKPCLKWDSSLNSQTNFEWDWVRNRR